MRNTTVKLLRAILPLMLCLLVLAACDVAKSEPIQIPNDTAAKESTAASEESNTNDETAPESGNVEECPHATFEWVVDVAATCSSEGSRHKECTVCRVDLGEENIPMSAHTEEIVPGKSATCTEKGLTEGKKCSVCDAVILEQSEIALKDHTEEIIPGKIATCTEKGLTDGKKCSVCDTVLVEQTEIPAKGHTEAIISGTPVTCTENGLTEGKKCSVCDTVLVEQREIQAKGHIRVIVNGTPATCTEAGLTDGKKCDRCGSVLEEQKDIPALTHTEGDWIIDQVAEVGKKGSKHTECIYCGITMSTEEIEALEEIHVHKGDHWTDQVVATCTEQGISAFVCSCGYVVEIVEVATIPHNYVLVNGKHATCTESGLTNGSKCSVCGEVSVAQDEIEPLGHTVEILVGKAPTCQSEGITEGQKCSICNEILVSQEIIELAEHTPEKLLGKAATCIETGLTEGSKCLICDSIIVEQGIIEKADHTPENVLGKAPSCTEAGLTEGSKCSVCDVVLVEQKPIEKLEHTPEKVLGKAPTCKQTGLTEGRKCSVCETVLLAQQPIAMSDHTPETVLGTDATCTASGTTNGSKCSVCDVTLASQTVIPPKGHSFVDHICSVCKIPEPHGVWIVDGLGNPIHDVIVKVMQNGSVVKMYPYSGKFLELDIPSGNYTLELDLAQLEKTYVYDSESCTLSPDSPTAFVRLFELPEKSAEGDYLFVGYPISSDYPAYYVSQGSYQLELTPGDYTFFVFRPDTSATYTITYESDRDIKITYHGGTFFVQGADISSDNKDISAYENGLSLNVYSSNIGMEYVFAFYSETAETCILNINNVGDPGTRVEDMPWTPYLEDEEKVAEQLAHDKSGEYTTIDLTDLSLTAVFNEADGYYHLNSADGPVLFIDLTTACSYIASIQTICANQRMGMYIYDMNGKILEKRSYNELFNQYGMPTDASNVDEPIRIPLTQKLAEAVQSFGEKNNWWAEDSIGNIFTPVHLTEPYNVSYAWLLFCGYYG